MYPAFACAAAAAMWRWRRNVLRDPPEAVGGAVRARRPKHSCPDRHLWDAAGGASRAFGSAVEHEPGERKGEPKFVSLDAVGKHGEGPVAVTHQK